MVQLIKKGGLRERANRSRSYQGSENTETTLKPNRYQTAVKTLDNLASPISASPTSPALNEDIPLNSSE
ncbi:MULTISPECIES: hypothetical protein [Acinetobacter]|jgi:hypothetical protein|uniref:hypothetical protein n=1 Tax=Acinetobacter TaxID=469 RepID=UPI000869BF87|nr:MULTISPECIES: hypothetical protein [Acinetobacter]ODN54350.1 hypothetical protein A9Z54_05650 [Acinetobacter sp. 51m]MCU4439562.1 hypothetical protein [Acinetobacter lwoffii]QGR73789.1 hypothetical protein FOB21_03315 [Acinetobacter lwoffii]QKT99966.1 hypothetical protein FOB20_15090 [Acinetobacter lwoffii]UBX53421.1 hypothetical protein LDO52_05585 [Acinetobacter pseudolwoffii]